MLELLNRISEVILNPIIYLLFAIALLVFLWGIFQMISGAASDEARSKGRLNIMWGIIGMLIMVSVYGILDVILNTFGITGTPGL
ncbi:MAG: hypothetical protein AAB726_03795 [Patescibacteria group bacterium]